MRPCAHPAPMTLRAREAPQRPFLHPFYNALTDGRPMLLDPILPRNFHFPSLRAQLRPLAIGLPETNKCENKC